MCEEGKKISFGFSKLSKPKVSIISNQKEIKKDVSVQFIDCVEDKSIKVKDEEPKQPEYLIIPLPKQKSANIKNSDVLDKILNTSNSDVNNKLEEKDDKISNSDTDINHVSKKFESLEELAAKEIIEDLKKDKNDKEEINNFSVPLTTNPPLGEKESTLEDYESIPVDKFGTAMLRGMGWAPGKGIGKNEKVVAAKQPLLRPKGLGLGADKVIKKDEPSGVTSEPIKLVKGSFIRIIAGPHKDLFGEVIGFDDETGRLIVKMTLGGSILTFNEFMIQAISKEEFIKNSRVINVRKFEEYKSKENEKGVVDLQSPAKRSNSDKKFRSKSNKYQGSSVSSDEALELSYDRKLKPSKAKCERERYYSVSSGSSDVEESKKKTDCRKTSSRDSSPDLAEHRSKNYSKQMSNKNLTKSQHYSRDDSSMPKDYKASSLKHSSRSRKHKSPSNDYSPIRSKSKLYDKHTSRKEICKTKYTSSSDGSTERQSVTKHKKLKNRRKYSSSDSSSSNSYRRNKEKLNEEKSRIYKKKKKSRRRSRSSSCEKFKRRSVSPKRHKKSKKSKVR